MSFSERLKETRIQRGLKQLQIAQMMGIAESTYCGYETGKRQPDVIKIKQLAKILDVSGDYLLETGFDEKASIPEKHDRVVQSCTKEDFETVIKKYRALDEHGKKIIDYVLNEEYERIQSICTIQVAARDIGVQEMYVGSGISNDLNQLPETDEDI